MAYICGVVVHFVYKCGIQRSAYNIRKKKERKEKANKTKHTRMMVNPIYLVLQQFTLIRSGKKALPVLPCLHLFISIVSQSVPALFLRTLLGMLRIMRRP